ncbi:MAG TPA: family 43 glycosylhydrolase [Mesorhizobium sp.]|jgi:hypothetical protein|nr:family 43 glycosylhydrolase [Mesorhizobium sp.]
MPDQNPATSSLSTPVGAPFPFTARISEDASALALEVSGPGPDRARRTRTYGLRGTAQDDFLDLFEGIARDFGARAPRNRQPEPPAPESPPYRVLLDENLSPDILYGYGDPAVLRVEGPGGACYYLVCTSNDAPDAFPILRSRDLVDWEHRGFAFPRGRTPEWAATGWDQSDFWAPELHRAGEKFLLAFAARQKGGALAIGLAAADHPEGPFTPDAQPLLTGGVIDPHLFVGHGGETFLFWKEDSNDLWPGLLLDLLQRRPDLVERLFPRDEDRRTACLMLALKPWLESLEPMRRFMASQTLIEAVTADFSLVRLRLEEAACREADAILDAMRTKIFAQELDPESRTFLGEKRLVLENDRDWEAHLIEGVWVHKQDGRFFLFYAGNDFSTPEYGTGVAVAPSPLGPYRKMDEPLLRSSKNWLGPGHPSVAEGPDGPPWLFLHAFRPGEAGYKRFRAALALPLRFDGDRVSFG